MKTRVVHCKKMKFDVYIGRPSKWGNPFKLAPAKAHDPNARAAVLARYREWLLTHPELLADLHELKGKTLGCWCSPQSCHGDVLAELAGKVRAGSRRAAA